MPVKSLTRFQCSDGETFDTLADANSHERKLELAEQFETIYGPYEGCRIEFDDFEDWAERNKQFLINYVKLL